MGRGKSFIFMILGMFFMGCQLNKAAYETQGIGPSKMDGPVNAPLSIFCSRVVEGNNKNQIDLSIHRQYDGTYTAFVRSLSKNAKNPSPVLFEALPNIRVKKKIQEEYKFATQYFAFASASGPKNFELLYFPASGNTQRTQTRVTTPLWQKSGHPEYLSCSGRIDIASSSPPVGSTLTVIGSVFDPVLKVHRQVHHHLMVDLLTQVEGQDMILSLSNQIPKELVPLNAPIYNSCGALVGYLKSYNPKDFFAAEIYNIHDEQVMASLKRDITMFQKRVPPPKDQLPSERLIQALCTRKVVLEKAKPSPGFPVISEIIASRCNSAAK